MSRKYESILIFNPDLQEAQLKDEERKIEELLRAKGATSVAIKRVGKREIAYPVAKKKLGNFAIIEFESPVGSVVEELTRILRITETVLKFQTHRIGEPSRKFMGNPKRRVPIDGSDDFDMVEGEY
jgi:small subunit ribosomal protein S6